MADNWALLDRQLSNADVDGYVHAFAAKSTQLSKVCRPDCVIIFSQRFLQFCRVDMCSLGKELIL
jgi:hypothetical protein